jgi:hypothetical protein
MQPETYVTTLTEDKEEEDIIMPEEVPLDDRRFNKYMERAVTGSRSVNWKLDQIGCYINLSTKKVLLTT